MTVDGAVVVKAASTVGEHQTIELSGGAPAYVSRAGLKLAGALDTFGVDPNGLRCLDVGASTGGFTDCLLQRGAASVVAVDVGTGQLHPRLRVDPRVDNREQTDIRTVDRDALGGPVDLAVADVSFISLRLVLPVLGGLVVPGQPMIVLVKPQFEAGRVDVARGRGVIRDPVVWRRVLFDVAASARALDLGLRGASVAGITGAGGNVEFVMWLAAAGAGRDPLVDRDLIEGMVESMVAHAEASLR